MFVANKELFGFVFADRAFKAMSLNDPQKKLDPTRRIDGRTKIEANVVSAHNCVFSVRRPRSSRLLPNAHQLERPGYNQSAPKPVLT